MSCFLMASSIDGHLFPYVEDIKDWIASQESAAKNILHILKTPFFPLWAGPTPARKIVNMLL